MARDAQLVVLGRDVESAVGAAMSRVRRRRRSPVVVGLGCALSFVGLLASPAEEALTGSSSGPSRLAAATEAAETEPVAVPEATVAALPAVPRPAPPSGVVPDPDDVLVLVDHERHLPPGWEPVDLVAPAVPFVFEEAHPKRLMRPVAASALERLVASARVDGVVILGVSAFRSEQTQRDLYESSVARHGEAVAGTLSARPGHSEHQTGLAIDVAGADGSCLVSSCFAETVEASWLAQHAARFGFVVRYPEGKEHVTGYQHEPWHLRFVGAGVAAELTERGITLDEYLGVT